MSDGEKMEGPSEYNDEGFSYLSCRGCNYFRRHDYHYYFCTQNASQPSYWSNGENVRQMMDYKPDKLCPFTPKEVKT